MKKSLLICSVLLCSIVQLVHSQEMTATDLERLKKSLQIEREQIFIQALQLTISQASVFHPIYLEFDKEKHALDDVRIKQFVNYAKNYQSLSQPIMQKFIKESEKLQHDELALRKKYYNKISKAISPELASQFYEVDDFVSTMLRLNILSGLPFIDSITQKNP
jgi:ABC-type transport system substrate-binding protein